MSVLVLPRYEKGKTEMSITLNKLIEHLAVCRDEQPWIGDLPVLLSKDVEGNSFKPTDGDFDIYTAQDADIESLVGTYQEAVILWPSW